MWTAKQAPLPAGADPSFDAELNAIVCPGAGSCTAVGEYGFLVNHGTGPASRGVIETLSGGTGPLITAPLPADTDTNRDAVLSTISCAAVGSCTVVGSYHETTDSGSQPLAVALSGGRWSPTRLPIPTEAAGDDDTTMESISCATAGSCLAVGTDSNFNHANSTFDGVLETFANGHWTAARSMSPDGDATTDARLHSVACRTPMSCIVVGFYGHVATGYGSAIVQTSANGVWNAVQANVPANAAGLHGAAQLNSVACGSPSGCTAVGSYVDVNGHSQVLVTNFS